jgi:hypothetical protein
MKESKVDYKDLTIEDIETLSIYYDYVCDGDQQKVIVIEKEK